MGRDEGRAELARRAAEAGNVAAQVLGDYGLGSPEAGAALEVAMDIANEAETAGVGPEEIKAARRAFGTGGER
ncbi:hypothetical protein OH717_34080 (plasmid) [Streptomyces albidoflavus]|nr:hypothetical protein OH717_34250 [Streptomyces albidoflavus]WTD07631.1 hypothetical protein OH717_34080 [Streptomyces albidoflavus]